MATTRLKAALGTFLLLFSMFAVAVFAVIPCALLYFIHYPTYRIATATLVSRWEDWAGYLFEQYWGMKYVISGDQLEVDASLIIANHRTRLDWAFLWGVFARKGLNFFLHIVLKSDIKKLPLMGWASQMARYLFLTRKWEDDVQHLTGMLRVIAGGGVPQPESTKYNVLIFPEGTDLHEIGIERSNKFARANGLPEYRYCLHPRARGFVAMVKELRSISASTGNPLRCVYDVTLAYSGCIVQNEKQLLSGKAPDRVHCHVRRFDVSALPVHDDDLAQWLAERFYEKERALELFYTTGGVDLAGAVQEVVAANVASVIAPSARATGEAASAGSTGGGAGARPITWFPAKTYGEMESRISPQPIATYLQAIAVQTLTCFFVLSLFYRYPLLAWGYLGIVTFTFMFALPRIGGLDGLERRKHDPQPSKPLPVIELPETRRREGSAAGGTSTPVATLDGESPQAAASTGAGSVPSAI